MPDRLALRRTVTGEALARWRLGLEGPALSVSIQEWTAASKWE